MDVGTLFLLLLLLACPLSMLLMHRRGGHAHGARPHAQHADHHGGEEPLDGPCRRRDAPDAESEERRSRPERAVR